MKRTFGVIGCAAATALFLCSVAPLRLALAAGVLCLLGGLAILFLPCRFQKTAPASALLTAAVAVGLFALQTVTALQPITAYAGSTAQVTAIVTEVRPETAEDSASYWIRVTAGDLPVGTKLRYWQSDGLYRWQVGEGLTGELTLTDIKKQTGDQAVAHASYADGIYLYAWPADYNAVSAANAGDLTWFERAVYAVRRSALGNLSAVSNDVYGVAAGLCLGDDSAIPAKVDIYFRRSGVSHLLVVSGLHISMVSIGLFSLLKRRLPARVAVAIALPVLVAFVCLMGLTPSVVRSGVMVLILLVSHLFTRQADSLNSMGLAFTVLALFNPFCIYDVGLQLSFGATLGILLFYRPIANWLMARLYIKPQPKKPCALREKLCALPEKLVQMLAVTLAATLPILPLLAFYFGEISLVSPLTNLLTVWVAEAEMVIGWIAILLGWIPVIGKTLAIPFGWVVGLMSEYLVGVTSLLGGWSGAVVSMRPLYLMLWLIGSLLLLILGYALLKRRGLQVAAMLSVICLAMGVPLHAAVTHDVTTVSAEYRFGGYAVLFQKNGRAGLILDGDKQSWKSARYLLEDGGYTELDFLFVTENWNAEQYVWFSSRFAIETVCTAARTDEAPTLTDGQSLSFWETDALETRRGFVRVTMADTELLICPKNGNAAAIPQDWRDCDAVIFQERAPDKAMLLQAERGVWLCGNEKQTAGMESLPWGAYPIDVPAEGAVTAFRTRGNGDIT